MQPCGTVAAYARHRYHGEEPCPEDYAAKAEQARRRRQARGAKPRRKPRHGTYSMYATYECRCRACRDAARDYKADHRAGQLRRSRRPASIAELILDILETFDHAMTTDQIAAQVSRIRVQVKHQTATRVVWRMVSDGRLTEKEPGLWWMT